MVSARLLLNRLKIATPNTGRRFSSSEGEKSVYKRALELQRPTIVKYWGTPHNFVSFIGTIDTHLKTCKHSYGFRVHTMLRVKSQGGGRGDFRILLKFWNEIAEMSLQHLKPLDTIYVSGSLNSYIKADNNGKCIQNLETLFGVVGLTVDVDNNDQVIVKEMNFVAQLGSLSACQEKFVKLKPKVSYEDKMQRRRDRLHLWQIFFASPYEWWDNRKSKLKPSHPDFKHKDTGEVLWLDDYDPPWIRQQLQLLDSRLGKPSRDGRNSWSRLSPLVYDGAL